MCSRLLRALTTRRHLRAGQVWRPRAPPPAPLPHQAVSQSPLALLLPTDFVIGGAPLWFFRKVVIVERFCGDGPRSPSLFDQPGLFQEAGSALFLCLCW